MKSLWSVLTGRGRSAFGRSVGLAAGAGTKSRRKARLQVEALEDRSLLSISFAAPAIYSFGSVYCHNPTSMVTADLTGNGKQDLVVTSNGAIAELLGNGDGTFQTPTKVQTPGQQYGAAVGDVNRDGKPDLVTDDTGHGAVTVLLGNGDGTFQSAVNYQIEGGNTIPYSVAVADLTGNGILDIIASTSSGTVDVLMGNGDGTFQAPTSYAAGGSLGAIQDMVVADVNGDGKPDIICATSNGASVLLNQGNGTFGPATTFGTGYTNSSVVVADLNGDGIPDIAITNPGGNAVNVLLGTGNGSFGAPQSYSTGAGTTPRGLAVANINGRADIVTADQGTSTVSVLANNGDGTFAAPLTFSVGNSKQPRVVAVADLNGDGKPDIITGNDYPTSIGGSQDVSVLLNTTPAPAPSFSVTGFPSSVTAGTQATITVTALNADGSVNTGYTGTVHFTSSDPHATLPADTTLTNGTGTFNVTLVTAGTEAITATDTSNGNMTGSESGITVTPAAATQFVISGPSNVSAGTAFNITVTAEDAYGNIATGYIGTVHFANSVGGATLPADYTFTSSDAGVHTFTRLKLRTKGTNVLTVKDTSNASISGSLTVKVT
jgi:hypothetical protein